MAEIVAGDDIRAPRWCSESEFFPFGEESISGFVVFEEDRSATESNVDEWLKILHNKDVSIQQDRDVRRMAERTHGLPKLRGKRFRGIDDRGN